MAEHVVDFLQPVEVEAKHREFLLGIGAGLDHLGQRLQEGGPVRQVGQAVVIGHVRHARFGLAAIGDVLVGLDQVLRLAGLIQNGHAAGQEQPQAILGRDRVFLSEQAALPDRRLVARHDQLRLARVEDVVCGEAGGVLAAAVEDGFGAAVGEQVFAVADAFDDQRDRNIVDDEFEELLGALQFARQRAAFGNVVEQRDQEFRLALLVAGDHAVGREGALLRAAFDLEFVAVVTLRRHQRRFVGLDDGGRGRRAEDILRAPADDVVPRETRETLEGAVGEDVAAILDVLGSDADRHVVQHRFEKLRGRRQFARQLALLGEVEMGRDRTAVGQLEIFDQHGPAVGQFRDEAFRLSGPGVEVLDAHIQHAAPAPHLQQLRPAHAVGDVSPRKPIDLEVAVVAVHDPCVRIGHHHTLVEVVQRGADEGIAAKPAAFGLAERRGDPEGDRNDEGDRDDAADQQFPDHVWIERTEIACRRESARCSPGVGVRKHGGDKAHDGRCRNQILAACLPILVSHQSPAQSLRRSVPPDGFGSGKRLSVQLKNVT